MSWPIFCSSVNVLISESKSGVVTGPGMLSLGVAATGVGTMEGTTGPDEEHPASRIEYSTT